MMEASEREAREQAVHKGETIIYILHASDSEWRGFVDDLDPDTNKLRY